MFYVDLERLQENNTGVWIDPINSFIKKLPNEKYSTLKIVIKNCRVYLVYVDMKGVIATYFFIGISTKREGEYDFKSIQEIKDVLKIHDDFNSTKPIPVFSDDLPFLRWYDFEIIDKEDNTVLNVKCTDDKKVDTYKINLNKYLYNTNLLRIIDIKYENKVFIPKYFLQWLKGFKRFRELEFCLNPDSFRIQVHMFGAKEVIEIIMNDVEITCETPQSVVVQGLLFKDCLDKIDRFFGDYFKMELRSDFPVIISDCEDVKHFLAPVIR